MFWIGFALTGFGGILNYFFDEKYNKWGKSKKKSSKKSEPKPEKPQNIELKEKAEALPITVKDTKGNVIVKESADDLIFPIERQPKPNGWNSLHSDDRN